ncbi:MAG: hypothetical protein MUE50_22515, partial [Pirellulaceae bacterium]|nr:hypothetical protein [Pirellulaceae bacterium]
MKSERTFGRREFLHDTATIVTAVAVGGRMTPLDASAATADPPASAIPTRTLGKTGLQLPILGYGGAALPTAWRNPLSHEDRVALVRHAFDRGVR